MPLLLVWHFAHVLAHPVHFAVDAGEFLLDELLGVDEFVGEDFDAIKQRSGDVSFVAVHWVIQREVGAHAFFQVHGDFEGLGFVVGNR